jgi:hypothetical protein
MGLLAAVAVLPGSHPSYQKFRITTFFESLITLKFVKYNNFTVKVTVDI